MEALGLNVDNLRELSFFLLPGLIFIYIFFLQIPDRKKSDLILVLLSVIASTILNFFTEYILYFVNFITNLQFKLNPNNLQFIQFLDPNLQFFINIISLILNTITHFKLNLTPTVSFFPLISIVLSFLLARSLAQLVRSPHFQTLVKALFNIKGHPFGRLWNAFFDVEDKIIRVTLDKNIIYVGYLNRVSTDPNDDVQEIELLNPYRYIQENRNVIKIPETSNMLIPINSIISIEMITDIEAKRLYKLPNKSNKSI